MSGDVQPRKRKKDAKKKKGAKGRGNSEKCRILDRIV